MMDIALVWDQANGRADFAVVDGDLAMDATLRTAAIISLFCDRLADLSDVLPGGAGDDDRRGFWGDPVSRDPAEFTGSKLWLRMRSLQLPAVARQIEADARLALGWMLSDGLVTKIDVTADLPRLGWVTLTVVLHGEAGPQTLSFPVAAA